MIELGLYEQLINKLISSKLSRLSRDEFYIKETVLDKEEAAKYLSNYLSGVIQIALNSLPKENSVENQIILINKIILLLRDELNDKSFDEDLLEPAGKILSAVFSKLSSHFTDFDKHLFEITPTTRFSQSELFTGSNKRVSMESELRKEILSADKIYFLVSFIKFSGIRIFEKELKEFTDRGKELKIITTTYMGATDAKAVEFLSKLKNTEVKISYDTQKSRLHAKAYLFLRNTGFHTGYIGSSNISQAALTSGLEWNLKITTKEISHILNKFQGTFETYWEDEQFELFNPETDGSKLVKALKNETQRDKLDPAAFFDIKPFHEQQEILDQLQAERNIHNRFRNLIVAATGTGKTVIAAFDYKSFKLSNKRATLLFVAHKKEILQQALATFRGILRDNNFGALWVDGMIPEAYEYVFASVQTLNNQLGGLKWAKDYFDFIIIDEVHHIAANSYRPILNRFKPSVLLGLTATPERMDGEDILIDFCGKIAAEMRLPEALNRKLLSPFQYFGITDNVDLSNLKWSKGSYLPSELTKLYTEKDDRLRMILNNLSKYLTDLNNVICLGFCASQEHAQYMAEKFTLAGLKADYLTSDNADERSNKKRKLKDKEINYLFVRDMFNEGVDIPEIDTVLFLRPTESLTIFLQQLGRGLRLTEGKECLTVLDFVGNARSEYDFEGKFRALIGKTNTSVQKEVTSDFPNLPLGCSIILEKVAKDYILTNIKNATNFNRNQLISKIRNFQHATDTPLTLENFSSFYHLPLQTIYKKGSWKRLCVEAGILEQFPDTWESEITRAISKKWLACNSASYFQFILKLATQNKDFDSSKLNQEEQKMGLMLYYDVWQDPKSFKSLTDGIVAIFSNKALVDEIIEVLQILISRINFVEVNIKLHYVQPLKIYSRYTREQIFAAFGFSSFENKSSNREGIAYSEHKKTELLFITLNKSETDYSPTTLYKDFAINDYIFHWQSQNSAHHDFGRGLSYLMHEGDGKTILLFVREQNDDEFGNTMGYVFLGAAKYLSHEGAKPMNIKWQLNEPMPAYLWKASAKMAIG